MTRHEQTFGRIRRTDSPMEDLARERLRRALERRPDVVEPRSAWVFWGRIAVAAVLGAAAVWAISFAWAVLG